MKLLRKRRERDPLAKLIGVVTMDVDTITITTTTTVATAVAVTADAVTGGSFKLN